MKSICLALGALLLLGTGCASVRVSPAALTAATGRTNETTAELKRWREAVLICNAFLQSTNRKTLPKGQVRLTDEGMEFVVESTVQPELVRCSPWGDVLVWFGMAAQERSDGFVVGYVKHDRSRLIDNSFFKGPNGEDADSAGMAELILHEMTHTYYHCGTVSFTKGVMYYLEAVFLFRYQNHSMERLPYQTSHEFEDFFISQVRAAQQRRATPKPDATNAKPPGE